MKMKKIKGWKEVRDVDSDDKKMGSEGLGKSLWELRKFLEVVSKCKLESKSRGLNLLRTRQRG